jgi:hypothetical protein
VQRDARDDQADAGQVTGGRDLAEHDRADDRGEGGQQGEHQRERGAGQPGHGELVGDVGDHGGAHAHADAPGQPGRVSERGEGGAEAGRGGGDRADDHRAGELVDPGQGRAARRLASSGQPGVRDPVTEHDVEHEAGAVAEREQEAKGLRRDADGGQRHHPGNGEAKGGGVAPALGPERGQDDGTEELDRPHGRQREPGDGEVEQRVHPRQDEAKGRQRGPLTAVQPASQPPGPAPGREHRGRAGDPQPHHAKGRHAGEQQHGQRGPKVVEDRRDHEE